MATSTFFRIFAPFKLVSGRGSFLLLVIYVFYLGLAVAIPYSIGNIIQSLELNESVYPSLFLYAAIILIQIIVNLGNRYLRSRYDRKVQLAIYRKYMPQFFHMHSTATESYGTGKLFSIVIKGMDTRGRFFVDALIGPVFRIMSVIVVCLSLIYFVSLEVGLVILVSVVLSIIISLYGISFAKPHRKKIKKIYEEGNRLSALWLMSKQEILQNNKVSYEMKRNDTIFLNVIKQARRIVTQSISYLETTRFILGISIIIIAYILIQDYNSGIITLGTISMAFGYANRLRGDIHQLVGFIESYNTSLVDIERLREFFDTTPRMKHINSPKKFQYNKGQIIFDKVSFAYKENAEVINKLSFVLKAKKKTALVGPSGGGKTTIMKLIGGFLEPTKGKILVDEQNINKLNPISYYKHIGYLTQEPSVFDGTIRENLIYGLPSHSDHTQENSPHNHVADINHEKKLIEALERAQCQFVFDFQLGIDTEIGEKGIRLSGGQRQRLAIAKIFLRNPEIILLDEPTSALDSMGEELVTKAMEELFKKRTVIIIAHRLQTVKHADEILYVENGQIVERGTHAALEKKGGKYARMLELQTGF